MKKISITGAAFLLLVAVAIQLFYSSCKKDACENFICWNGGTCDNGTCVCASGWEGDICTTPVGNADPCLNVVCQNGGACVDGTCSCTVGYEGVNCETETRAKFIDTWSVNQSCSVAGNANFSVIISNGSTIQSVNIANFWNEFATVNATITGNTITIPSQSQTSGSIVYTISGNGTLSNNQILISYSITNTTTSVTNSCTATWQ